MFSFEPRCQGLWSFLDQCYEGFPQSEENRGEEESLQRRTDCIELREAESSTVTATARQHGVAEQTIYRWRRQFSGMEVSDVR